MPYPEMMIKPMRDDLTRHGVEELRTLEEVDAAIGSMEGTALVFVNSVCGCAAGAARPGLAVALESATIKPDKVYTVFAGQDLEATARARSYFGEFQPSSPSIALLKDGEVVSFVHRYQIEGRAATDIATHLVAEFEAHCR